MAAYRGKRRGTGLCLCCLGQGTVPCLSKTPALKQLLEKARSEESKTTIPNTENNRKETVANSRTYVRINADSDIITDDFTREDAKRKKAETLALNRKNGADFKSNLLIAFGELWQNVQSQIMIQTDLGRVRVDAIGWVQNEKGDSVIRIAEFKSSKTAPLTRNQKRVFPEIVKNGGIVVGKGKTGFGGGTIIPPGTVIEVVRGSEGGSWYVSNRFG